MPDDEPIQQVIEVSLERRSDASRADYWQRQWMELHANHVAALAELERIRTAALTLCSLPEDVDAGIRDWRLRELRYALTDDPNVLGVIEADPVAGGVGE